MIGMRARWRASPGASRSCRREGDSARGRVKKLMSPRSTSESSAARTGPRPERPLTREDVLDAVEVAQLVRAPRSTVLDWARRGAVPARKRGRRWLFLRWEIEDWLSSPDRA